MADHDFNQKHFSPNGELIADIDDDEFVRNDTQVLNLEDGPQALSEVRGSTAEMEEVYQAFDGASPADQEEAEQIQLSPGGILDEETVALGLQQLGSTADGTHHAYLHLIAPGYQLNDISILEEYVHLQKVEIPMNEITDLSPLGCMPFLLELDASNNQISSMLNFTPPKNLQKVDLSFNNIEDMGDLSAHHYLQKLVLDNNHIREIKGLEKCKRLVHLSMAHNKIDKIQGVCNLPIKFLNMSHNELKRIEGIETLRNLTQIDLSGNQIRSMNGLQKHPFLEIINLEDNEIIDLAEVQYMKQLQLLRDLNLHRNPIREIPDYRLSILYHLQGLTELDRHRVDVEEKVSATNMFNPPLEVIAARDHIMHVVYNFLQPCRILDSTLPSAETPYPMLVLVGPQGAGKKDLAMKLCEEFPDYFGYGLSHTTRPAVGEETNGRDYNFVTLDEFENEIKAGKFLQTYAYHGELFGLTIDAIETVAKEGLACVVHMELEGVLTLKNTYFEPRYVLVMPLDRESHERRLRERNMYTEEQVSWMLDRSELYAEHNRQNPGFFDMFINSDDITEAYTRLRKLVMDYLGISAQTPEPSEMDRENTESNFLGRENTDTTFATSANFGMGQRTWSKPSLADSMSQALTNVKQRQAQSPIAGMARGIVEEKSLERRKSALKEAVQGTRPNIYQQIIRDKPATVPVTVTAQLGLGEDDDSPSPSKDRVHSAPINPNDPGNMDALPPASPDSSLSGSTRSDTLSNISEAREIEHRAGSPDHELKGSKDNLKMAHEALERLELLSGSGTKNLSNPSVPLAPRPDSQQADRPLSGRPGSERHPVLPPIATA